MEFLSEISGLIKELRHMDETEVRFVPHNYEDVLKYFEDKIGSNVQINLSQVNKLGKLSTYSDVRVKYIDMVPTKKIIQFE